MQKSLRTTYILLIALTLLVVVLNQFEHSKGLVILILSISLIKFLTVAFQFMELKSAHSFWKVAIVFYSILIVGILMLLY